MGSRSKTGNKKKQLENRMAQQAALILNIPNNCKVCNEPFDKKNKMTLRDVAKRLKCSFVRVKQLEESALKKMNIRIGRIT